MKKLFFCTLIMIFSNMCLAAGFSTDLTVENLVAEDNDIIIVYTSGGAVYTAGCIANNWVIRVQNSERLNRIYSTLMAALVSGKKVQLWYADTCDSWSYHGASAVKLVN